jgi:hypothetical protein
LVRDKKYAFPRRVQVPKAKKQPHNKIFKNFLTYMKAKGGLLGDRREEKWNNG